MFTTREKEVMELLILGYSNKEIAEQLIISEHTVKAHKEKIFAKLDAHNNVQAVVKFIKLFGIGIL